MSLPSPAAAPHFDLGKEVRMGLRSATWKILKYGAVPPDSRTIDFECPHCGHTAELPVIGTPIAQFDGGIVFDNDQTGVLPESVQCRKCRQKLAVA